MPNNARCVWFATNKNVTQISLDNNAIANVIASENVRSIGMGCADCGVFVLTHKQLTRYDTNGGLVRTIELAGPPFGISSAKLLAIDPYDQSAWIAEEHDLYHSSAVGQLVGKIRIDGPIRKLVVNVDQTVWVLANKQLLNFDYNVRLLKAINPSAFGISENDLRDFGVDALNNGLWLLGNKSLVRIDLKAASAPALTIPLPKDPIGVAVDPSNGVAWIASKESLSAYMPRGQLLRAVGLTAANVKPPSTIAFDSITGSVWLGGKRGVHQYSANGDFIATFPSKDDVLLLATPAIAIRPTLALVRPTTGLVANNPNLSIALQFGATQCGAEFSLSPADISAYRLTATINGQAVGNLFTFDPVTRISTYVPSTRIPEGLATLEAYVTDRFGRRSEVLTTTFTIDTIAPRFVDVAPMSGSTFAHTQITVSGRTDDPNASVNFVNLSNWNGTGANPQIGTFSYLVSLNAGINSFTLNATDLAGNVTPLMIDVTSSPLVLTVKNPTDGANINDSTTTVAGSISGPAGTSVMVNGSAVALNANNSFWCPGSSWLLARIPSPSRRQRQTARQPPKFFPSIEPNKHLSRPTLQQLHHHWTAASQRCSMVQPVFYIRGQIQFKPGWRLVRSNHAALLYFEVSYSIVAQLPYPVPRYIFSGIPSLGKRFLEPMARSISRSTAAGQLRFCTKNPGTCQFNVKSIPRGRNMPGHQTS